MRRIVTAAFGLAMAAVVGCAPSRRASGEGATEQASRDRNVLTQTDFSVASDRTLFDAITRLRSTWLIKRGSTSLGRSAEGDVVVYMDGVPLGTPQSLRQIRIEDVREVRFLSAADATTRFGTNHQHGAIVVTSRR